MTVRRGSAALEFRHRLTNLSVNRVPFTWNLHVAHPATPTTTVHVPATRMLVEAPDTGRFGDGVAGVAWPVHDGADVSGTLDPSAGVTEFLHAADLREGWCAVVHGGAGAGLELRFDPSVFRTVWMWGVYGGWRGHQVLLTEPCTGRPGGLAAGIERGDAVWLDGGEVLETRVTATAFAAPGRRVPGDVSPLTI